MHLDHYPHRVGEQRHADDGPVAYRWAVHMLGRHQIDAADESPVRTTNPWSTVIAINTSRGRYWLKQAPLRSIGSRCTQLPRDDRPG
jgi:hypothetical protein